jgi:hypothetical protein
MLCSALLFSYVVLHSKASNLCALAELLWLIAPQHSQNGKDGYYLSQLTSALQFLVELDTAEEAEAVAIESNSVFAEILEQPLKPKPKPKLKPCAGS